jgi:FkbM family methyltransferase
MSRIANAAARLYGAAARVIPFDREPFATLYSAAYFAYKRFEDPFAKLMEQRPELFDGGAIIDAGANIGYTSLLFARRGRVHAFEPEPANVRLLRRNVARSRHSDRIVVHAAALGATSGKATLWQNRRHRGDHRMTTAAFAPASDTIEVDVVALDDVIDEPVSFVKLDVQGYELEVSRGMEKLMAANPRIRVAFELAPQSLRELGYEASDLVAFYETRGFVCERLGADSDDYVNVLCARTR